MLTWEKQPELMEYNQRVSLAMENEVAARGRFITARDASTNDPQNEELSAAHEAAKSAHHEADAALQTAAQEALDHILPALNSEERVIYDALTERADRLSGLPYPLPASDRWLTLLTIGRYMVVPVDEWFDFDARVEAAGVYYEAYQEEARTSRDVIVRVLTEQEAVGHGPISVRDARQRLGLGIAELARRSGVDRATISRLENGHMALENMTLRKARALADALGVDVDRLIG